MARNQPQWWPQTNLGKERGVLTKIPTGLSNDLCVVEFRTSSWSNGWNDRYFSALVVSQFVNRNILAIISRLFQRWWPRHDDSCMHLPRSREDSVPSGSASISGSLTFSFSAEDLCQNLIAGPHQNLLNAQHCYFNINVLIYVQTKQYVHYQK